MVREAELNQSGEIEQSKPSYVTNHTYFKEFFTEIADVYFFRIVDQMAQMNHETNWKYTLTDEAKTNRYMLDIITPEYIKRLKLELVLLESRLGYTPKSLEDTTLNNNGFYLLDSLSYPIISDTYVHPHLPVNFPRLTRQDYLNAHLDLFQLLKFGTNYTLKEYDEEILRQGIE